LLAGSSSDRVAGVAAVDLDAGLEFLSVAGGHGWQLVHKAAVETLARTTVSGLPEAARTVSDNISNHRSAGDSFIGSSARQARARSRMLVADKVAGAAERVGLKMAMENTEGQTETIDAVGKASEALEYVERARGHLYAFHQLIGRADFLFEESARSLAQLGHRDQAGSLWHNLVGRDVLENRWTFEIVERFDEDYYDAVRSEIRSLEQSLVGGRRHAHEEALRRRRRDENPLLPPGEVESSG
jgi:hypothetical protein